VAVSGLKGGSEEDQDEGGRWSLSEVACAARVDEVREMGVVGRHGDGAGRRVGKHWSVGRPWMVPLGWFREGLGSEGADPPQGSGMSFWWMSGPGLGRGRMRTCTESSEGFDGWPEHQELLWTCA
jgi:hypothetical protein